MPQRCGRSRRSCRQRGRGGRWALEHKRGRRGSGDRRALEEASPAGERGRALAAAGQVTGWQGKTRMAGQDTDSRQRLQAAPAGAMRGADVGTVSRDAANQSGARCSPPAAHSPEDSQEAAQPSTRFLKSIAAQAAKMMSTSCRWVRTRLPMAKAGGSGSTCATSCQGGASSPAVAGHQAWCTAGPVCWEPLRVGAGDTSPWIVGHSATTAGLPRSARQHGYCRTSDVSCTSCVINLMTASTSWFRPPAPSQGRHARRQSGEGGSC